MVILNVSATAFCTSYVDILNNREISDIVNKSIYAHNGTSCFKSFIKCFKYDSWGSLLSCCYFAFSIISLCLYLSVKKSEFKCPIAPYRFVNS